MKTITKFKLGAMLVLTGLAQTVFGQTRTEVDYETFRWKTNGPVHVKRIQTEFVPFNQIKQENGQYYKFENNSWVKIEPGYERDGDFWKCNPHWDYIWFKTEDTVSYKFTKTDTLPYGAKEINALSNNWFLYAKCADPDNPEQFESDVKAYKDAGFDFSKKGSYGKSILMRYLVQFEGPWYTPEMMVNGIKVLVKYGAKPYALNEYNWNLLYYVRSAEVFEMLLKIYPQLSVYQKSVDGLSLFDIALANQRYDIVELLFKKYNFKTANITLLKKYQESGYVSNAEWVIEQLKERGIIIRTH